jgi:hypothetical protein
MREALPASPYTYSRGRALNLALLTVKLIQDRKVVVIRECFKITSVNLRALQKQRISSSDQQKLLSQEGLCSNKLITMWTITDRNGVRVVILWVATFQRTCCFCLEGWKWDSLWKYESWRCQLKHFENWYHPPHFPKYSARYAWNYTKQYIFYQFLRTWIYTSYCSE